MAVRITFAAEPPPADQSCPGNPEASATVELPAPIGDREIVGAWQSASISLIFSTNSRCCEDEPFGVNDARVGLAIVSQLCRQPVHTREQGWRGATDYAAISRKARIVSLPIAMHLVRSAGGWKRTSRCRASRASMLAEY
jgi:hypothetical protein